MRVGPFMGVWVCGFRMLKEFFRQPSDIQPSS